jgi:Holliday junction resolvase-like predicted endonuclease
VVLRNKNGLAIRTNNLPEILAIQSLLEQGYTVVKRGWPDLVAIRGDEIRFIEVKDLNGRLRDHQYYLAEILNRLGVDVEIWPTGKESQSRFWNDDDSDKMYEESDDDMGPE